MPAHLKQPSLPHPSCRLAIIGEAPGTEELLVNEPFVGSAGKLLQQILGHCNLSTDQCLLLNIIPTEAPSNELSNLPWEGDTIQAGIAQCRSVIDAYQPNCILSLGRAPMRMLRPDLCYTDGRKLTIPLDRWRGSIVQSDWGHKTVFAFHPTYVQRAYSDLPYFRFDVARAVEQSRFPELRLQRRDGIIEPTLDQVLLFLDRIRREHLPCSADIEGWPDDVGVTCISICPDPFTGIVIPFWHAGRHYWTESEELLVWQALSAWLADPACSKTFHNGFYEYFVLAWKHRCVICGWTDDTMMKFWELYPELEKNLGVVNSFCTEEPYYKDDRKSSNHRVKLEYNFKDSAVTDQANRQLETILAAHKPSYDHYRFNVSIAPAITYLNLRGCRLDKDRLNSHVTRAVDELSVLQQTIDNELVSQALAADVLIRKRKSDPWTFNVKSTKQKQWLLYTHLGYKPSGRWGPVTDEEAMLRYYVKDRNPTLRTVIQAIRKRTRLQDLAKLVCDSDGRIRTSLDIVGTNTGRSSSRQAMAMRPTGEDNGSWENTGTNLQNVTKEIRDCFVPDSDQYDFWQFDLRGADAWTVATDLAALGYSTMLEDMLAGIKPAKVLMALLAEYEAGRNPATINNMSRAELKAHLDNILIPDSSQKDSAGRPGDWKYDVCKKVQHGTNYDAKPDTISALVFGDSDGLVDLTKREAEIYQFLYKLRYKPEKRNDWIRQTLSAQGYLQAACGIKRKFFAIRNPRTIEDDLVRAAAAFEPQANTTYCTNRALLNLWSDTENRSSRGWLHCDPLLQIHDALAGQNHSAAREWAHRKLRSYFSTQLVIHGLPTHIPVDGGWGANWLDTKRKLIS